MTVRCYLNFISENFKGKVFIQIIANFISSKTIVCFYDVDIIRMKQKNEWNQKNGEKVLLWYWYTSQGMEEILRDPRFSRNRAVIREYHLNIICFIGGPCFVIYFLNTKLFSV